MLSFHIRGADSSSPCLSVAFCATSLAKFGSIFPPPLRPSLSDLSSPIRERNASSFQSIESESGRILGGDKVADETEDLPHTAPFWQLKSRSTFQREEITLCGEHTFLRGYTLNGCRYSHESSERKDNLNPPSSLRVASPIECVPLEKVWC